MHGDRIPRKETPMDTNPDDITWESFGIRDPDIPIASLRAAFHQGLVEIVSQQPPLPPGLDVIPRETEIEVLSRGVTIGFIDKYLMSRWPVSTREAELRRLSGAVARPRPAGAPRTGR
jgi:hypothetical protein